MASGLAMLIGCGRGWSAAEPVGEQASAATSDAESSSTSAATPVDQSDACEGWCTEGGVALPDVGPTECELAFPVAEWIAERWYPDTDDAGRLADAIAIDDDGGVMIAGRFFDWYPYAIWIARFDARGEAMWEHVHESEGQVGSPVMTRAGGRTILAATLDRAELRSYDDDGSLMWERVVSGDGTRTWWLSSAVATATGGVVAGGFHGWPPTPWITAYGSDGETLWSVEHAQDSPRIDDLAVDDTRVLVSAGAVVDARALGDGTPLWSYESEQDGPNVAAMGALAIHPDGSLFAAGTSVAIDGPGLALRTLATDGTLLGAATHLHVSVSTALAEPSGSVIVLGRAHGCFGSPPWIAELSPDGAIVWGRVADVTAIAIGGKGRIVATGHRDGAWSADLVRPEGE